MSGFNYELGRSNNMVRAEEAGKITIGRWAKRFGVSAKAAIYIMKPNEAHHTGAGRRGKTRITPVIDYDKQPTESQLCAMHDFDAGKRPEVRGWFTEWTKDYDGPYGRRRNIATVGIFQGLAGDEPKGFHQLSFEDFEAAKKVEGRRLTAYATRFDDLRESDW